MFLANPSQRVEAWALKARGLLVAQKLTLGYHYKCDKIHNV